MEETKVSLDKFLDLVRNQFEYGGKKYALSGDNQKESTDVLFDKYGKNWLIGTIDKYTFRFKNLARERDLLKIATYMYILWLKRGFFVLSQGINDPPIDTNLKIKSEYFDLFNKRVLERIDIFNDLTTRKSKFSLDENGVLCLNSISSYLGEMANKQWKDISEYNLIIIFYYTYYVWDKKFLATAGSDTDTNNEDKK